MQRLLILPVAALLVLPAVGCGKVQARAELKKGNSYYQQEQYAKALDYFKRDGAGPGRHVRLALGGPLRPRPVPPGGQRSEERCSTLSTAVDAFEKYLAEFPDDTKVEDYLLSTYVNARKFDEALAFIDQRMAAKPEEAAKLNGYKIRHPDPGRTARPGLPARGDRLRPKSAAVALYSIAVSAWDKVLPRSRDHGLRVKSTGSSTWGSTR